jgi:lipopolysaccharide/colanic/teichoic acid biosynthesis glycosyltransferase
MKSPLAFLVSIPVLAALGALSVRGFQAQSRSSANADLLEADFTAEAAQTTRLELEWRRHRLANSTYKSVRNVLDRVLAFVSMVVLSPVLFVIAAAISLDSPGPVLFRQRRVGMGGRPFTIIKFRTLRAEAPRYSLKLSEYDSRITRVGKFLRRSGLDELPQLWNVFCGEMAMIGPRPEQIELIDLYEPWQRQRESVRPGITGWWQVHHRDGEPLHHHVDRDLYYIRHQGPWIDLLIVLATMRILLTAVFAIVNLNQTSELSSRSADAEEEQLEFR